jgi:hypothetical protein
MVLGAFSFWNGELPDDLKCCPICYLNSIRKKMVGVAGFEPATLCCHQWMKTVLEVIPTYKVNRLTDLLPQNLEL